MEVAEKLVDLVQVIHGVITQQFNEVKRAMYGYGDYDLADEYQQFAVPFLLRAKSFIIVENKNGLFY